MPHPSPRARSVLITTASHDELHLRKVRACAVLTSPMLTRSPCSDLHMYEGRTAAQPGIVFGHENMGIVDEVADGVTVRHLFSLIPCV